MKYWTEFKKEQKINTIQLIDFTDEEEREFVIKDNVNYGMFDFEMLANDWDAGELVEWGVNVWNPDDGLTDELLPLVSSGVATPSVNTDSLPEELRNIDINADNLPKISGDDLVAMERVIIVYPGERMQEVAKLIGLASIKKVVYSIDEILQECATREE